MYGVKKEKLIQAYLVCAVVSISAFLAVVSVCVCVW